MTPRVRKLVALALAGFAVLIAATYEPFGGTRPADPIRFPDPAENGYAAGVQLGVGLAMEDVRRFKTPDRIARYLAVRDGLAKDQREAWCAAFVKGFERGMARRESQ